MWPPLRARVAAHPGQVALADELEAEHAVIEPLLTAFHEQWEPKYATLDLWNTAGEPA